MNVDPYLTQTYLTQIASENLNASSKTINLLEEHRGFMTLELEILPWI